MLEATAPLRIWPAVDGHRTAERRSLAMHALIAEQLDDAAVDRARARVADWLRDGGPADPHWAARWQRLLVGSTDEIRAAIVRDDAEMTQLRQTTPFAGALSNAERWRVLREVT